MNENEAHMFGIKLCVVNVVDPLIHQNNIELKQILRKFGSCLCMCRRYYSKWCRRGDTVSTVIRMGGCAEGVREGKKGPERRTEACHGRDRFSSIRAWTWHGDGDVRCDPTCLCILSTQAAGLCLHQTRPTVVTSSNLNKYPIVIIIGDA